MTTWTNSAIGKNSDEIYNDLISMLGNKTSYGIKSNNGAIIEINVDESKLTPDEVTQLETYITNLNISTLVKS